VELVHVLLEVPDQLLARADPAQHHPVVAPLLCQSLHVLQDGVVQPGALDHVLAVTLNFDSQRVEPELVLNLVDL